MTLGTALAFTRRWIVLLVLGPLLAGLVGYLVVQRIPPVYASTVTLLVSEGSVATNGGSDALRSAQQLALTYVEVLRTRPVLEAAAAQVGLDLPYRELEKRVNARVVRDTQLVRVSVEDTDPAVAAAYANAVADVFTARNLSAQQQRFADSRENLARLVETLRADIEARGQRLEELKAAAASPDRDAELVRLQAELTQLQATYSSTVRSYEDVRVAEARGMNTLTLVEPAVPPTEPVRPQRLAITLLAMLGGLATAVGFAVVSQYLDDRLRDGERVRAATGLTSLGLIPERVGGSEARDVVPRRLAESYRLLFSNLQVATGDQPLTTLLITSPAVGEGKSTTAASLALVLAEAGRRVLLVDADLHRPTQAQIFNVSNRRGLSTLLLNPRLSVRTALQPTRIPTLSLLTSGPTPADPSALFASSRLETRLAELRKLCEIVIFDTPPVLAQPDAPLLGSHADAVLLVADATRSKGREAARALGVLVAAGANVVGAVLNRVPRRAMDYGAYGYYQAEPYEEAEPTRTGQTGQVAAAALSGEVA